MSRFVKGQLYLVDGEPLARLNTVLGESRDPGVLRYAGWQVVQAAEPWGGPPDPTPEELNELLPTSGYDA